MKYSYIFRKVTKIYPFKITSYVKKQIKHFSFKDPVFKMYYPHLDELRSFYQKSMDPYFEEKYSVIKKGNIPILVHKYPSRVLIVTTNYCPALCRFCMRKKNWGKLFFINKKDIDKILNYIKTQKKIEEVLVSGGEPITLGKDALFYLLENLEKIDHVKIIRFATKAVLTAPNLFTKEHIDFFKNISKLIFIIHINHLNEVIEENKNLLRLLANDFKVFSQTVLLKGINDTYEDLSSLFKFLRNIKIKPYYLFDCDPVKSVYHFKVDNKKKDKL
ncbi:MAG TPA: radical SAM protein, partial [Desulfurobacteriaceae bacterium]|nr:radical SAM protein [Desulfurobacteriaceae bacterium]